MSRKYSGFLMLIVLLAGIFGCTGIRDVRYDPSIPAKSHFENVNFELYIYSWDEFQKIVLFYFGEPQPGCVGFTISRPNGEKIVIMPRKKDSTIDLETLGHEIFYHVLHDTDH